MNIVEIIVASCAIVCAYGIYEQVKDLIEELKK